MSNFEIALRVQEFHDQKAGDVLVHCLIAGGRRTVLMTHYQHQHECLMTKWIKGGKGKRGSVLCGCSSAGCPCPMKLDTLFHFPILIIGFLQCSYSYCSFLLTRNPSDTDSAVLELLLLGLGRWLRSRTWKIGLAPNAPGSSVTYLLQTQMVHETR